MSEAEHPPERPFTTSVGLGALDEFLRVLDAVANEAVVTATPGELSATVADPAKVTMVTVSIGPIVDIEGGEESAVGINVRRLREVVDNLPDQERRLDFEPEYNRLTVSTGRGSEYHYEAATLAPDTVRDSGTQPTFDHPVSATFQRGAEFRQLVEYFDAVGDAVRFETKDGNDGLIAEAICDGTDEARTEHAPGEFQTFQADDVVWSKFYTDYLSTVADVIPDDGTVTLGLGDHDPLSLTWRFADAYGEARYLQAPRVE